MSSYKKHFLLQRLYKILVSTLILKYCARNKWLHFAISELVAGFLVGKFVFCTFSRTFWCTGSYLLELVLNSVLSAACCHVNCEMTSAHSWCGFRFSCGIDFILVWLFGYFLTGDGSLCSSSLVISVQQAGFQLLQNIAYFCTMPCILKQNVYVAKVVGLINCLNAIK